MQKIVLVHDPKYQNWIFDSAHPTQGRRFEIAKQEIVRKAAKTQLVQLEIIAPRAATEQELLQVHTLDYINTVLIKGESGEWAGSKPELAELAQLFTGGTLVALEALIKGVSTLSVNLAGAKHHAMQNYSSGFCVFNDFAIAAKIAQQHGYKVAIFDLDAHHGDGTEELLRTEPILTYSVHDATIFPGTGMRSDPNQLVFNKPLAAGAGDKELDSAVSEFIEAAQKFGATMIFIACGADGHALDPLSTLNYSVNGIASAVAQIRSSFLEIPMLIGGAGGYQPDTFTPEIWSNAVLAAGTVIRVQTKRHYWNLAGIDLDDDQQLEDLYDVIIDTLIKTQEEKEES